jgi:hypothetical protein
MIRWEDKDGNTGSDNTARPFTRFPLDVERWMGAPEPGRYVIARESTRFKSQRWLAVVVPDGTSVTGGEIGIRPHWDKTGRSLIIKDCATGTTFRVASPDLIAAGERAEAFGALHAAGVPVDLMALDRWFDPRANIRMTVDDVLRLIVWAVDAPEATQIALERGLAALARVGGHDG